MVQRNKRFVGVFLVYQGVPGCWQVPLCWVAGLLAVPVGLLSVNELLQSTAQATRVAAAHADLLKPCTRLAASIGLLQSTAQPVRVAETHTGLQQLRADLLQATTQPAGCQQVVRNSRVVLFIAATRPVQLMQPGPATRPKISFESGHRIVVPVARAPGTNDEVHQVCCNF
jgi:hypothetical protein